MIVLPPPLDFDDFDPEFTHAPSTPRDGSPSPPPTEDNAMVVAVADAPAPAVANNDGAIVISIQGEIRVDPQQVALFLLLFLLVMKL